MMETESANLKIAPRVLVITMYCGEPQIDRCIKSVESQVDVSCDHKVISNKPNVEAHKELYDTINSNTYHDYFLKLDADMEFSNEKALSTMLRKFSKDVDYVTFPVFDFMTNDDMPAVHIFSDRVKINTHMMDNLYVDHVEVSYPGIKLKIAKSEKHVLHCYNPNEKQSVAFGMHRALKVLQNDRFLVNLSASKYHFITLKKLYDNYAKTGNSHLLGAINAANMVLLEKGQANMVDKKRIMDNAQVGNEIITADYPIFHEYSVLRLLKIIGFKRGVVSLCFWLFRKIT